MVEVSIMDAKFTGSILPPWIAEVEVILKYSDDPVLQRRTAREAKAVLGSWFSTKVHEYLFMNVRTPGHESREQIMASCFYLTGYICNDLVLQACLKNGLVVKEESWYEYVDRRDTPPNFRYTWISNEYHYEGFQRLDRHILENQLDAYQTAQRFPHSRSSIPVQAPVWKPKRPKVQTTEQP